MTDYQSTLLKILSRALFSRTITLPDTDWIEVLKEAKSQAVTQLDVYPMSRTMSFRASLFFGQSDLETLKVRTVSFYTFIVA